MGEEGGSSSFCWVLCLMFCFGYEMSRLSSWSLHDSLFWGVGEQQRAWECKTFMHLLSSSGDLDIMRQLAARNLQSCRFPWIEVSAQFVVSPHSWCTKCLVFCYHDCSIKFSFLIVFKSTHKLSSLVELDLPGVSPRFFV